ncbi:membrane protein [Streptomyces viridochromogenes]|uniref:Membrane protein n=1 Tax=Streptomyces viridochromogenes TaxID=1938 RepID=A0A0J7Z0N4_STRVR|nr:VC0807 family protein [Streptomyces viridochromogenes]KMS68873.1 membrane protein [Streptomyces viridochromogenes]KOG11283.1 membrane protein [Streptomyces viridochromogenes]KOG11849.1 membrane protein [Streptomyces viridochromogenes]
MTTNTGTTTRGSATDRSRLLRNFAPLLIDVAVPLGAYYLLRNAFGTSTVMALGLSSVVPAVRTGWGVVRSREVNGLATLILFVNVVSLLLGFVAGDPRLMVAKDSAVSSTIGIGIIVSVVLGKPMMTAGMKPWVVKGDPGREAAWARLHAGSARFRRAERMFSLVWGVVLLTECVVRVVGAYTLPVDTMVWLGNVIMVVAMGLGFLVGGALGAGPMAAMVIAEAKSEAEVTSDAAAARGVSAGV